MDSAPAKGMIDLGIEQQVDKVSQKGTVTYPILYIRDVYELDDLPDGEFYIKAKVKVTQHTENEPVDGKRHCSCEISFLSLETMGPAPKAKGKKPEKDAETRLDEAFTKIEQDKSDDYVGDE